ncbi:hypothetical protein CFP56_024397 [Quercus suber]|uniref:Uncharacterized protein n=1 Tax=Quercus suber TaxID=58331 RepID=A0AAW0MCN2_QUESU
MLSKSVILSFVQEFHQMCVIEFCFDPNVVVLGGKRKLRSLFWRVRAEVRRQVKSHRAKEQKRFSFNYDPFIKEDGSGLGP